MDAPFFNPSEGDLVRYRDGATALAILGKPHAGGWHGAQCCGGTVFFTRVFEPTEADKRMWLECAHYRGTSTAEADNRIRAQLPVEPKPVVGSPTPNFMEFAPRDGSLLRLLVEFEEHAIEDEAGPSWTIGSNNFDHDGEDEWKFAGWCWSHDHFTSGKGKVVGWLPLHGDKPIVAPFVNHGDSEAQFIADSELSVSETTPPVDLDRVMNPLIVLGLTFGPGSKYRIAAEALPEVIARFKQKVVSAREARIEETVFDAGYVRVDPLRFEELVALQTAVHMALPATYYLDPPDGGNVSLAEQVTRMGEDAAKWRKGTHNGLFRKPALEGVVGYVQGWVCPEVGPPNVTYTFDTTEFAAKNRELVAGWNKQGEVFPVKDARP